MALGLDMAANPDNWGFAALLVDMEYQRANMSLLLPHAKINKDRSLSPTLLCRPHPDFIRNGVLQLVRQSGNAAALAVDVPLDGPSSISTLPLRGLQGWLGIAGATPIP